MTPSLRNTHLCLLPPHTHCPQTQLGRETRLPLTERNHRPSPLSSPPPPSLSAQAAQECRPSSTPPLTAPDTLPVRPLTHRHPPKRWPAAPRPPHPSAAQRLPLLCPTLPLTVLDDPFLPKNQPYSSFTSTHTPPHPRPLRFYLQDPPPPSRRGGGPALRRGARSGLAFLPRLLSELSVKRQGAGADQSDALTGEWAEP